MAVSRMVPGWLARVVPQVPLAGPSGLAIRAAVAMLGGNLLGKFVNRQFGEDFAFGGILSVADEATQTYVLPSLGVGAYMIDPYEVSRYLPDDSIGNYLGPGATLPARYSGDVFADAGRLDAGARL